MPIAGNHTVLNVSSDREVLGFSSRVLRDAGFHVIEVADLAKLPAVDCHPDLILMDTRLGKEGRCAFVITSSLHEAPPPFLFCIWCLIRPICSMLMNVSITFRVAALAGLPVRWPCSQPCMA